MTQGISEVLDRFEGIQFTCEWKYDGERLQVHVLDEGARIETFSRNSECTTGKYPDVVRMLRSALKPETKSVVVRQLISYHIMSCHIISSQWSYVKREMNGTHHLCTRPWILLIIYYYYYYYFLIYLVINKL